MQSLSDRFLRQGFSSTETKPGHDYRALRKLSPEDALGKSISYDIEGVVDFNDVNSPISILEEGIYNPSDDSVLTRFTRDTEGYRTTKEITDTLQRDRFHGERVKGLGGLGLTDDYAKHAGKAFNSDKISQILGSGTNIGVWNADFETRAWGQTGNGLAPEDVLTGDGLSTADEHISHAKSILGRLEKTGGEEAKGVVFDQADIARGFLAQMGQEGKTQAMEGNYKTGVSVDVLGRAFTEAGLWGVPDETHVGGYDAKQSHEMTNFMANYLNDPSSVDDAIMDKLGGSIDKHRVRRAGYLGEKAFQGDYKSMDSTFPEQYQSEFDEGRLNYRQDVAADLDWEAKYNKTTNVIDDLAPSSNKTFNIAERALENIATPKGAAIALGVGAAFIMSRQILTGIHADAELDGINRSNKMAPSDFGSRRTLFNQHSMTAASMMSGVGMGAVGLYLFNNGLSPNTHDWGRASQYGVDAKYQRSAVDEEHDDGMSLKGLGIVTQGTRVHEEVQKQFQAANPNIIDEYAIWDPKSKLTGHIDMLVPMNVNGESTWIPTEIKTISSKGLSKLSAPKEGHRAQAQFYLHYLAEEAEKEGRAVPDFEQFLYVSRDDPTKFKTFKVERSEDEFQWYLSRWRAHQKESKAAGNTPKDLTSHYKVLKDVAFQRFDSNVTAINNPSQSPMDPGQFNVFTQDMMSSRYGFAKDAVENFPRRMEGLRRSHPTNPNEFEAMKPNPGSEFPGARRDIINLLKNPTVDNLIVNNPITTLVKSLLGNGGKVTNAAVDESITQSFKSSFITSGNAKVIHTYNARLQAKKYPNEIESVEQGIRVAIGRLSTGTQESSFSYVMPSKTYSFKENTNVWGFTLEGDVRSLHYRDFKTAKAKVTQEQLNKTKGQKGWISSLHVSPSGKEEYLKYAIPMDPVSKGAGFRNASIEQLVDINAQLRQEGLFDVIMKTGSEPLVKKKDSSYKYVESWNEGLIMGNKVTGITLPQDIIVNRGLGHGMNKGKSAWNRLSDIDRIPQVLAARKATGDKNLPIYSMFNPDNPTDVQSRTLSAHVSNILMKGHKDLMASGKTSVEASQQLHSTSLSTSLMQGVFHNKQGISYPVTPFHLVSPDMAEKFIEESTNQSVDSASKLMDEMIETISLRDKRKYGVASGAMKKPKNRADNGSPFHKIWDRASIEIAETGVDRIRTVVPMRPPVHRKLHMGNYHNAKYGPQMSVQTPRLNYNETTQSRLSGVVA